MKHDNRIEKSPSRRSPSKPRAISRPDARGTLDRLVAKIDARRGDNSFGAAFRAGGLVRGMRKQAGLSQQQLANALGVTQARISEIEAGLGAQGPTWALMERIAAACGRTIGVVPEISSYGSYGLGDRVTMGVHEAAGSVSYGTRAGEGETYAVQELNLVTPSAASGEITLTSGYSSASHLAALRAELRDLDAAIKVLTDIGPAKQRQLLRLKKRKIQLSEEIRLIGKRGSAGRVRAESATEA